MMLRPLHHRPVRCPTLHAQAAGLWHYATAQDVAAQRALRHGVLAVITALLVHAGEPPSEVAAAGGLSEVQVAEVVAFIERRMEAPIGLADFAEVVGLSVSQFSRAFKLATGTTPHQYLLSRRVAGARRLLEDPAGPALIEVALSCGFASQSHMTDVFRQRCGVTPGALRAAASG